MVDRDIVVNGRRVIQKEGQALLAFADSLDSSFAEACDRILACKGTVVLTGIGKSGLIARKWASTFASTGTRAYFVNPAEAPHGDLGILRECDLLIALSFSGETEELGYLIRHATEIGMPSIGVTGNPRSSLARQVNLVISVELSEEACPLGLAPTTSTTVMMALGDAIAMSLMQMRGFTEKDFARLHPGGSLGRRLWLRVTQLMHSGDALPTVAPNALLKDILIEMTQKCLGLAVVCDNGKPLGVITDGDLRRWFQRSDFAAAATATDLMTLNPKTISGQALAVEARVEMEKHSIQHLLIVDNGVLVGVVHLKDLLRSKVL